jgi:hypothetical protein
MKQALQPIPGGEDEDNVKDPILPNAGGAQDNFDGFEQPDDDNNDDNEKRRQHLATCATPPHWR